MHNYELEYNKNKKICLYCGEELPYDKRHNKFCSSSCSAKYNNPIRTTNKEHYFCINCGKELPGCKRRNKFCNNKCHKEYQYKKYINEWKNGKRNGMSGEYSLSKHIRKYMLEKSEYKCELCGWGKQNSYTGKIPLEIHHIDGDYRNNKEDNLQVLCPNCHSLTQTYKSANKNGRKSRSKYKM